MILSMKNYNPNLGVFPENTKWERFFALIPRTVDDGRLVWLEYIHKTKSLSGHTIYATIKY